MSTLPSAAQLMALEAIINQALTLDPVAQQRLQLISGKSIRLECTEPAFDLAAEIEDSSLRLLQPEQLEHTATSHLSGDLSAFSKLLSDDDKAAALINADLRLQGDSRLLIELQEILVNIDLDWEHHLAKIIGDMPAHFIGKIGRDSFNWLRSTQPIFMRHLQEYLVEETRLSPNKIELENFIQGVQELDERTERLQTKLTRLKQLHTL